MDYAIEVKDVRKSYGDFEAVRGMSFNVPKGTCFGVLGPNGAGKTTLMGMMEGITQFGAGSIQVLGMDIKRQLKDIQPRVGIQLQSNNYFRFLSVGQLLKFYVDLRRACSKGERTDHRHATEILEQLALADKVDVKVSELSGGQAQRFSIAIALLEDPEIVFLDEPTSALDPQNRRYTWEFIERIKRDGNKTIILTTHFMEEAETLCDDLLIMDQGKTITQGPPEKLVRSLHKHQTIFLKYGNGEFPDQVVRDTDGVVDVEREPGSMTVHSCRSVETVRGLFDYAAANAIEILEFDVRLPNLEDVFISKTGAALRDV